MTRALQSLSIALLVTSVSKPQTVHVGAELAPPEPHYSLILGSISQLYAVYATRG